MKYNNPKLQEIFDKIQEDIANLEYTELATKYLGKNGLIRKELQTISQQPSEKRKEYAMEINSLKKYFEERISQLKEKVEDDSKSPKLDPSAPFDINTPLEKRVKFNSLNGTFHPLMKEMKKVLDIFSKMGFEIMESRQLDSDYNMFESLNIPSGHPARDIWDTFWTDENLIPPAHTSTMQNRSMKKRTPPIRVVIPGRCYRNEATDASHEHTFYQIEGVYVDKNISMGDMLGTIKTYLESFFETNLDIKVQPAYFPFVEPGCEFMISCPFCKKTGCSVCGYNGWMEIMGCGMIHPNVLREANIDPEIYSGFAWGFGLDRLVMLKHSIGDLRRFHSGDLNFLKQF